MLVLLCRLLCFSLWSDVTHMHRDNTKTTFTLRDYQASGTNRTVHNSTGGSRRWHASYSRVLSGKNGKATRATWDSVQTWLDNTNASSYSLKSVDERTNNFVLRNNSPDGAAVRLPSDEDAPWRAVERMDTDQPAGMETRDGGHIHLKSSLRHKRGHHRSQTLSFTQERETLGRHRRDAKDGERKDSKIGQPTSLSKDASPTAWEPLPRPLAQNQSSDFPFDMTRDYEPFTSPDLEDSTPFVPINTRPRRKEVQNPFFPVTAESYGAYAILIISAIIFTVGIIGNMAIMCIVCHNYYMRSISNSLLANLALWDFVVIFFCLPLVIFHELTKDWLLGEFSCKIIPYLEVASLGVMTFTLCALCIDRFRAATNVQMYYEMIENCASTGAKLAVIWIGALLLALPELLIRQLVTEDGEPPDVAPCERCVVRISTELPDTLYVLGLTYDGARLWWYFGCYFCLPTLFTIGCSLATARKIRQVERTSVRGNKKQIQLESQMNCTVVALAILYGFCIIPENICNIVSVYMAAGVPRRTLDILHLVSQLFLFCKSAVTPVLLFCLCQPFSRAFMDCCCCCCQECGPPRSSMTATTSDNDEEGGTTELEMSAFGTIGRQATTSPYAAVGTHC